MDRIKTQATPTPPNATIRANHIVTMHDADVHEPNDESTHTSRLDAISEDGQPHGERHGSTYIDNNTDNELDDIDNHIDADIETIRERTHTLRLYAECDEIPCIR
eukprot:GHVU01043978.1.p3 GENE.GHVU01043978.1~~GHVU01043978.1.p3  ORF type:complete len:105 (-),score=16.78 GHVU01043978.1:126-440(-)